MKCDRPTRRSFAWLCSVQTDFRVISRTVSALELAERVGFEPSAAQQNQQIRRREWHIKPLRIRGTEQIHALLDAYWTLSSSRSRVRRASNLKMICQRTFNLIASLPIAIEHFQPLHDKRAIENGRRNRVRHLNSPSPRELRPRER